MPKNTYLTHDNGGRPYIVVLSPRTKTASVFVAHLPVPYTDGKGQLVIDTPYLKAFVGKGNRTEEELGNSILLQIDEHSYMFVGSTIYTFQVPEDETIKQFYSPVGNNDVPYPYLVGKHFTYFLLDKKTLPSSMIDFRYDFYDPRAKDAYNQFYFNTHLRKYKQHFAATVLKR